MSFDYKYPPPLGAGVIDNLFQEANRIPTSYRPEFNIPSASRPEICALHIVNPAVDESFLAVDERGYLILSRPITGDNTLPEIEAVYTQGDEKIDDLGWKFLLKPVDDKPYYQVHIDTQFPKSDQRLDPVAAAHIGDFAYKLINCLSRRVTEEQTGF